MRVLTAAVLLGCLAFNGAVAAELMTIEPEEIVRRAYAAFGQEERSDIFTIGVMMEKQNRAKYFAQPLVRLLDANDASYNRHSLPCIDFMILVNGSDYDGNEIRKTLKIDSSQDGNKTVVVARFSSFQQPNVIQFEFMDDGSGPKITDIASMQGSKWKLSAVRCSSDPFWIGRWYVDDPKVCRGRAGETEGLLVYTKKDFFGYENRCAITQAIRRRSDFELKMRCRGEGRNYSHKEIVGDASGQLRRDVEDGRRVESYIYSRCPI